MTEEEYFRKNYPDSCYGDKLLSPYWDLFQAGVEFGERQSEKQIEELEKENAELKGQVEMGYEVYNNNLDYSQHIEEQLTKAKTFIKDYMIIVTGDHTTVCSVPEENRCINVLKLNEQAEQFLKEVDK